MVQLALLGLVACSEYRVNGKPEDPAAPVPGDSAPVEVDTAEESPPPEETGETGAVDVPATVPCDDVALESLTWWGSMPFSTEPDPADSAGRPFYAWDYEMRDWSTVSMPDSGHNPSGNDRAYRGVLSLPSVGERIFVDLQSDDGLWLWVNGLAVGHWGGDWQEEGCVNDEANCLATHAVDPVEVTAHLVAGENLFAARVSNAIEGSYFQLHARCVE